MQLLDDVQPLSSDRNGQKNNYPKRNQQQNRNVAGNRFEGLSRFEGHEPNKTNNRFDNRHKSRFEPEKKGYVHPPKRPEPVLTEMPQLSAKRPAEKVYNYISTYKKVKSNQASAKNSSMESNQDSADQSSVKKPKKKENNSIKTSIEDMYE